jgi:hypothetical protein
MRAQIAKLSADEFEGRAPATPGDTKARQYIVEQLQEIGFKPGGPDGRWQQPFDVVGITAEMPKQWTFSKGGKKASFKWWDQYIAGSGVQTAPGRARSRTPKSCSSVTASRRPSTAGTISRART